MARRSMATNEDPNEQETHVAADADEGTYDNASRVATGSNVGSTGSSESRCVSRLSSPMECAVCIKDLEGTVR